ncbi:MAG: nitrous oxide-stimulated promoter family protein [Bacteroidetes bacterium]|nr:nitrous oxide-stimulated promoter family protein [Bacteroidota bacterium]
MTLLQSRKVRELKILSKMFGIYCSHHHRINVGLCAECSGLMAYAEKRLEKCKFGESKPVCKDCQVHCYSPKKREDIKKIMRWSGPRMAYRYPLLAACHLLDSLQLKQKPIIAENQ